MTTIKKMAWEQGYVATSINCTERKKKLINGYSTHLSWYGTSWSTPFNNLTRKWLNRWPETIVRIIVLSN